MKTQIQSASKSNNIVLFIDSSKNVLVDDQWKSNHQKLFKSISEILQMSEFKVDKPSLKLVYPGENTRVILAALGKEINAQSLKKIGGKIGRFLNSFKQKELDVFIPNDLDIESQYHLIESIYLGNYSFKEFKSKKEDSEENENIQVEELNLISESSTLNEIVKKAEIFAIATNSARDWGNRPGNYWTPSHFGEAAKKIGKETGLKVSSLGEKEMKDLGFGCFLGVTQGSDQEAFLHILEYKAKSKNAETLMLVGKGLTFDAGGISLKPGGGMDEMKFDMCGGAAVMNAMQIIGKMQPDINVIGLIPSSENMINGKALKPGDILTAYNGKTVEILNTDAEGRLILCDAIAYGVDKYKPKVVVDIATLTGAVIVGLGKYNIGLMSNNENVCSQLKASGKRTGDRVWELPTDEEYGDLLKGTYADLQNIGGREAGSITAGMFLKNFIGEDTQWAHLDIAGMAWNVKAFDYFPEKGATGAGTRLLADFVLNWKK